MSKLKLIQGGKGLILDRQEWVYDHATKVGEWVSHDVSSRAIEFLFQDIEIDENVTLGGIFQFIEANPLLKTVFRQDFVNELCDEATKDILQKEPFSQNIEYLELYQVWSLDTHTKEYSNVGRFCLHGIGYVQEEDLMEGAEEGNEGWLACKKGDRINWGVSMTPVREMLALPVRLNHEVIICEDDLHSKQFMNTISTGKFTRITLGVFIREVLWELSWHGSPEETKETFEDLLRRSEDIKSDAIETIPMDDVFESLGCKPESVIHATFFNGSEKFNKSVIGSAIRNLEDNECITTGLKELIDHGLLINPEFTDLTGRELRKMISEKRHQRVDI